MKGLLKRLLAFLAPVLGLVFVFGLFLVFTWSKGVDEFWSIYNLKTILTQSVIVGIGALGMTFIIIGGGIDLSAGSMVALGTVVCAWTLNRTGADEAGVTLSIVAALAAVGACGLCGLFNGAMISTLRIVPFIITLGTMQIARGVAKWIANEQTLVTPDTMLTGLMDVEPRFDVWYSIAPAIWIVLLLLVGVVLVLRYTVFGRYVFAIGSNEATARLCGINVRFHRMCIYTVSGMLVGVASVMQYANLAVGDPTAATGMELDIIAAVVIGGGSLNGGEGSAFGSIVGALIMTVLRNGCNMVGIPNFVQEIVIGAIIISAVGLDRLKHRGTASAV